MTNTHTHVPVKWMIWTINLYILTSHIANREATRELALECKWATKFIPFTGHHLLLNSWNPVFKHSTQSAAGTGFFFMHFSDHSVRRAPKFMRFLFCRVPSEFYRNTQRFLCFVAYLALRNLKNRPSKKLKGACVTRRLFLCANYTR